MSQKVQRWTKIQTTLLQKTVAFDLYSHRMRSPESAHEDDYYVLRTADWANIIPITDDRHIILINQFRHGIESETLEVPGGIVDANEPDPLATAARELKEETGYIAREIRPLGAMHPNPAILNNRCHAYVALGATLDGDQNLDPGEFIQVERIPFDDIPNLIRSGKITHANILSSFLLMLLQYGEELGCGGWLK